MFFSENSSAKFANKSNEDHGADNNTSYDIIEHDVTGLAKVNHLPPPDSLDALQLGNDR